MSERSLIHLNGNLLCSIDVETTGLIPGFHDIIEVAILPLNSDFTPRKDILPFNVLIKPKRLDNIDPKAMSVNKLDLLQIMREGFDPYFAAELFDKWVEKLKLPLGKQIAPLAQNWPFDREFISDWLGKEGFNLSFFYGVRDLKVAANFINDCFDFRAEPPPFPKQNLSFLCNLLGVQNSRAHRALEDAAATAECYKKLVRKYRLL